TCRQFPSPFASGSLVVGVVMKDEVAIGRREAAEALLQTVEPVVRSVVGARIIPWQFGPMPLCAAQRLQKYEPGDDVAVAGRRVRDCTFFLEAPRHTVQHFVRDVVRRLAALTGEIVLEATPH